MAIFAQRTTFRNLPPVEIKVTTPLAAGQVLLFDTSVNAFVNKPQSALTGVPSGGGGGGGGTVVGGTNLGAGSEVFKDLDSNLLRFRTIGGGPGITVEQDTYETDEVTVVNDIIIDAEISVPDTFTLVIDNDNNTVDTALFQISSYRPSSSTTLTPVSNVFAAFDISVVTDITFTNPGQFITASGNFVTLGFEVGMSIEVSGTNEQDGIWEIASITTTTNLNDTITITVPFTDATDAGSQPATTITGVFFKFPSVTTFQSLGIDWVDEGFSAGQTITLAGTTDNDGTYTILSISGDTITTVQSFPGTLGNDVGTIVIATPAGIQPTGWWVNELGEMQSNDVTIVGDLDVSGDTNIDGDLTIGGTLTIDGDDIMDVIINLLPVFPDNGILVQTSTNVFDAVAIVGANGINVADGDGIGGFPTITANDFDITLTGDATGSSTVTGLSNTSIAVTFPTIVTPGTYNSVTVDAKGRVTAGSFTAINLADYLPLVGGTMTGDIVLDGSNIVMSATETVDGRDLSADGAVLDSLNTGTGIKVQTAANTFTNRTIIGDAGSPIVTTNADGVAGNPTIGFDITLPLGFTGGEVVNPDNDLVLIYDASVGETRKVTVAELVRNQEAFRYFYAQI